MGRKARMPEQAEPRGSRAQQVATEIETQILSERTPAGTRLGLRTDLISRFGVSPSVMNEALRILRERNLVTVKPGPRGGVIVDSPPPQVRLGGIDVWHQGLTVDPEELFEARYYLDTLLTTVALQRATPDDVRAMEWALEDLRAARNDARAFLEATMRLHVAIARASHIDMLAGLYQTIVSILSATITKAAFIQEPQELLDHSIQIHTGIIVAIREQDSIALEKLLALHNKDTVRVT